MLLGMARRRAQVLSLQVSPITKFYLGLAAQALDTTKVDIAERAIKEFFEKYEVGNQIEVLVKQKGKQ